MTKKILKMALVLSVVTGLGILGYHFGSNWYDNKYGESYRWSLSDNLTVIEYNNGNSGILNDATKQIVGIYDRVFNTYAYDDNGNKRSVFVVVKNNLRGYISAETGEVIFEPQFLHAWIDDHENNLAACVNKDGKLGFVDVKTKQTIIPFQFDYNEYRDYVFHNGLCCVTKSEYGFDADIDMEKKGIIDTKGNLVLPIEYDYLQLYDEFSVKVGQNGKYGYFVRQSDTKFKAILLLEYDYLHFTEQGIVVCKDGVSQLLDSTATKVLRKFYFNDIEPLYEITDEIYTENEDEDGYCGKTQETRKKSGYLKYYISTYCYGVVDNNFKMIIPAKYDAIEYIGNGFFKCQLYVGRYNDPETVILNSKGEMVNN
jgi:hypothetical protein